MSGWLSDDDADLDDDGSVRHLFTAAEAQRVLGIRAGTVRQWARRGKVHSYGLAANGDPMYDRDDLRRVQGAVDVQSGAEQRDSA